MVLSAVAQIRYATSHAVYGDWPGVLQPAAIVNLMDEQLNHQARGRPKQMACPRPANLPEQFIGIGGARLQSAVAVQSVGVDHDVFARFTVTHLLDECLASRRMAAHQAAGDLQILSLRPLAGAKHSFQPAGVRCAPAYSKTPSLTTGNASEISAGIRTGCPVAKLMKAHLVSAWASSFPSAQRRMR